MKLHAGSTSGAPQATPGAAAHWPGQARLSRIADVCALATAAIGVLALVGWLLGIEPLKRVLPGLVAMKFNTALAFVMGGAALWWRHRPALRLGLGATVAAFGALALSQYFLGGDWGIDQLFFHDVPDALAASFPPGRMAASTSLCFLLCGVALMSNRGSKRGPYGASTPAVEAGPGIGFVVDVLAFGAAAIACFALIGYATGTESLRHLPGFISMALNTAAAFVFLAAGILCAAPEGMIAQVTRSRATGRTLWIGFGLLTILLAILGIAAAVRLQSITENLHAQSVDTRLAATLRDVQNTGVLILGLLVVGVLIAMVTSKLVGRAVLGHSQALRASEERLSSSQKTFAELVERSPFGTYIVDSQFRVAMMNAASQEGAFRNVRPVIGRDFSEAIRILWPEAVAAGIIGHFRRTLETGEPYSSPRFINPRHDVEIVEAYEWELHRLTLPDGQFGVICYYYDSTKLRQAEEALRETSDYLEKLLGYANAPIICWDPRRAITRFNPAFERLTGYAADEILGRDLSMLFPDGTRDDSLAKIERALTEWWEVVEIPIRRKDGETRVALWNSANVYAEDGQTILATIAQGQDITARKRAEETLRESEGRFRALTETSSLAVGVSSSEGKFLYVNKAYEKLFGYTQRELDHLNASELWRNPEDRRGMTEAIRAKGFLTDYEVELKRKDGTPFWGMLSINSVDYGGHQAIMASVHDITARRQAEQALRESEERAKALVKYAPTGIYEIDLRGKRFITVNDAMCQTLGYTRDELLAVGPMAVLNEESRRRFADRVKGTLSGQPVDETVEYQVLRKDGSAIEAVLYVTFSLAGDRALVVAHDVTERKRAEEAIRASEGKLRGVLDATQESIWVFDPDGVVLLANAVALSRMQRGAGDIIGKHMTEILPQDLGRSRMGRLREVVESARPVEFEDERAGFLFHHSFFPALDSAGRVMFVVSFSQDITERKKTEALRLALAEQDRVRLGAAVEQASDSVVMFDLDGTIRYVNAAFEAANRIPRDGAVGRSYFNFFAGHQADAALREAIAQGRSWHGSVSRPIPDGGAIDLEVTVSPAKEPSGTVIGGLATETDVTQKNALQQQIRQAQKMEALGTLAGGITHDFNNILGTIIINTELALLDMGQSDPGRAPLPVVLQAANRGKELVKQIITFSRQRAWERKPFEIAPVVKEGMGLLRSTLPKNIAVHEKIDPRSGIVLADPSHVHQILVNLCQNAALAMMDRGGDLDVGLAPVEVDAFMAVRDPDLKPGPYIRLTVSDTGCGMGSEILERIFEPFFTTREQSKGSGLGLAVVHGIVRSYDGAISVQSQPGKGSVFSIYFHRLDGAAAAAGVELPVQAVGGRERILLVEDEETQRTSLARGLEHLGYKITAAADGRVALSKFRKDPKAFDLVVTDQIMPRMSGLELASELAKIRPDIPVILCTGFSEKVDDGTVGRHGIRELVMKPFTITEITRAIGKALKKDGAAE
jgi:PAS domain S-box-containing protein